MGLNLRLSFLRLHQKINFRILLLFLYIAITTYVLVYHLNSASKRLELVVAEVKGGKPSRGAEFILTGGQDEDFRRNGFQVVLVLSVSIIAGLNRKS